MRNDSDPNKVDLAKQQKCQLYRIQQNTCVIRSTKRTHISVKCDNQRARETAL